MNVAGQMKVELFHRNDLGKINKKNFKITFLNNVRIIRNVNIEACHLTYFFTNGLAYKHLAYIPESSLLRRPHP